VLFRSNVYEKSFTVHEVKNSASFSKESAAESKQNETSTSFCQSSCTELYMNPVPKMEPCETACLIEPMSCCERANNSNMLSAFHLEQLGEFSAEERLALYFSTMRPNSSLSPATNNPVTVDPNAAAVAHRQNSPTRSFVTLVSVPPTLDQSTGPHPVAMEPERKANGEPSSHVAMHSPADCLPASRTTGSSFGQGRRCGDRVRQSLKDRPTVPHHPPSQHSFEEHSTVGRRSRSRSRLRREPLSLDSLYGGSSVPLSNYEPRLRRQGHVGRERVAGAESVGGDLGGWRQNLTASLSGQDGEASQPCFASNGRVVRSRTSPGLCGYCETHCTGSATGKDANIYRGAVVASTDRVKQVVARTAMPN